jgi:heme/copper-type cytochrome/quinol oxidase subunit 2
MAKTDPGMHSRVLPSVAGAATTETQEQTVNDERIELLVDFIVFIVVIVFLAFTAWTITAAKDHQNKPIQDCVTMTGHKRVPCPED